MPTCTAPLVTVITAYYNRPEYIRESIESALAQTHAPVEVIVVDDGSTEDAHRVLRAIPGTTIIRQPNAGVAAARNRGLAAARGEYVIFLDHDDRLMPDAIVSHLRAIQSDATPAKSKSGKPKAGLVFGALRQIDGAGQIKSAPYVCAPRRNYFLSMLQGNPIHCPAAAMILREAMLAVGGMDPDVAPGDDLDLYLRIARQYRVVRHTDLTAEYRLHSENVSHNYAKMMRATERVLDKVERTMILSPSERRSLKMGRARAALYYGGQNTILQKAQLSYFRLRSLLQMSIF